MKTKQPKPKLNRQILDEASAWFVDFRVGDVDPMARERFDQWLRQSPEHIRAYMEIAKTYVELPALNSERKIDVPELIAYGRSDGNVVAFEHPTHPSQPLSPAADSNRPFRAAGRSAPELRAASGVHRLQGLWIGRTSIAASIAIVCIASLLTWFALNRYSTYTTQIGERRSITLTDGSTIDLNARSKVRIKFSKAERDVELVDGQALFEVAKDKARPFIVRSGDTIVRAIGTQFDVYHKKNGTTVTVIDGRVAVLTSASQRANSGSGIASPMIPSPTAGQRRELAGKEDASGAVFLSAGERVTVTDQAMSIPERTNIAAATAWVQHRLIFDGSRLSDVVDDFNRYNARQLVIEDPALDDFHVSGVYSSTDPASLVRFLRSQPGIDVIETDKEVRVTRK
jgi:transmembrane sensor